MVVGKVCYVRRRRFARRCRACKFGLAIRDDEDSLVVLRRFRNFLTDIHRDDFEESISWKNLKLALMTVFRFFFVYHFGIC